MNNDNKDTGLNVQNLSVQSFTIKDESFEKGVYSFTFTSEITIPVNRFNSEIHILIYDFNDKMIKHLYSEVGVPQDPERPGNLSYKFKTSIDKGFDPQKTYELRMSNVESGRSTLSEVDLMQNEFFKTNITTIHMEVL